MGHIRNLLHPSSSWAAMKLLLAMAVGAILLVPGHPQSFGKPSEDAEGGRPREPKGELAAALETLRLSLGRIRSIQYKAKYRVQQHVNVVKGSQDPIHQAFVLDYEIDYKSQGNHFSGRSVLTSSLNDQKRDMSQSYDGVDHRRFDGVNKVLDIRRKSPPANSPARTSVVQPITAPLLFAFEGRPYEFTALLNMSLWDQLAGIASLQPDEEFEGRSCSVLVLERRRYGALFRYKVYLDKARDDYPVRTVVTAADSITETKAVLSTIETDVGAVQIPLEVRSRTRNHAGELTRSSDYEIDPSSLQVNEDIDRTAFTLDEGAATGGIRLIDERRAVKPASRTPGPPANRFNRIWLSISIILILGTILGYGHFRSRRRRRGGTSQATSARQDE